jgi:hypothetical protein
VTVASPKKPATISKRRTLDRHVDLRGEGSIPVPLPPPHLRQEPAAIADFGRCYDGLLYGDADSAVSIVFIAWNVSQEIPLASHAAVGVGLAGVSLRGGRNKRYYRLTNLIVER